MSGPKVLIHWPIFYFRIKKVIKAFNPVEKGLMVVYHSRYLVIPWGPQVIMFINIIVHRIEIRRNDHIMNKVIIYLINNINYKVTQF